jgi:nicotinamidase/pyrazinamidase
MSGGAVLRRAGVGLRAVEAFDPRSALVVVDVQNDFADPAGSLAVRGGADIVPLVNELIAAAEARGALVAYTQDWHPPHTPHFAPDGGIWPVHCVGGTWGAELHPQLDVRGPRVRKGSHGEDGYSGFTMRDPLTGDTQATELEGLLRQRGVTTVAVCGLATDYCVRATALDAVRLGFTTVVLDDAVRAVDLQPGDGARAIAEMAGAGVAVESAAVR